MKVKKGKKSLKRLMLVVLSLLIIGMISLFILEKLKITDFIRMPSAQKTVEEQQQEEKKVNSEKKRSLIEEKTPQAVEPPKATNNAIVLNASQEATTVTVLTRLSGISSGTCTIKITNNEKNYQSSAPVIYQPEFSSCAGFSIKTDALGPGKWTIDLSVAVASGETLTKSIDFEVKQ